MSDVEHLQAAPATLPRPVVQIVPVRGLPLVAAVVVFVIVAIAGNFTWALTFCHVVGGGLWTAIDLFVGLVVGPILGRLSIPARMEFTARFMPKMHELAGGEACLFRLLFPHLAGLDLDRAGDLDGMVQIVARTSATSVACRGCGVPSTRVHDRYQRRLQDLSCGGRLVQVELMVRRFRCGNHRAR